jgi:hypothetical protein
MPVTLGSLAFARSFVCETMGVALPDDGGEPDDEDGGAGDDE